MMLELLTGCAGMLITLLAYFLGRTEGRFFRTEGRFFCLGEDSKNRPCCPAAEPQVDREKQLRFEEEQKALADCMNYSIDIAYGGSK